MNTPATEEPLDELPRRSKRPLVVVAIIAALAAGGLWLTRPHPTPEAPEHALFRTLLPAWVVAKAREAPDADEALARCVAAAAPWPEVAHALQALPAAWADHDAVKSATRELNRASHAAALEFWVDPQFTRNQTILTTYEVLGRTRWKNASATTEVLQVRRLDTLNLEMGVLGHAGGDLPAVLRDRVEVAVVEKLRTIDDDERAQNDVDALAGSLWRAKLGELIDAAAVAEAERRLNHREQLVQAMEHRLRDGRIHVARPERLVFGDAYFDSLEPYTSTKLRGGPVILSSDLRSLRHADEALDDSDGLRALVRAIDLEAETVEAHEAHHALDQRELPTPELLQRFVGANDLRFGKLAERELRAYLGALHDAHPPGCLTLIELARLARGRHTSATPHFFAAHALLATLGDVDAPRGLDETHAVEVLTALCKLPDAELRTRAANAFETLYGAALQPATQLP